MSARRCSAAGAVALLAVGCHTLPPAAAPHPGPGQPEVGQAIDVDVEVPAAPAVPRPGDAACIDYREAERYQRALDARTEALERVARGPARTDPARANDLPSLRTGGGLRVPCPKGGPRPTGFRIDQPRQGRSVVPTARGDQEWRSRPRWTASRRSSSGQRRRSATNRCRSTTTSDR